MQTETDRSRALQVVATRLPIEMRVQLEQRCRREGRTLSSFMREAIAERLSADSGQADERQT